VDPAKAAGQSARGGETFFFCSLGCKKKFDSNPTESVPVPASAEYTCPMHPEVVRNKPGACPICGMALEPREVTGEEECHPELEDMTRRFWVGVALTAPLLILMFFDFRVKSWLEFALATPVVLWAGWPFFERGWASLVNRSLNMFTLIALGTGASYLFSVVSILFLKAPLYFEPAAVITTLVLLGQVLELRARSQTSSALKSLLGLAPKTARMIDENGGEEDVPIDVGGPAALAVVHHKGIGTGEARGHRLGVASDQLGRLRAGHGGGDLGPAVGTHARESINFDGGSTGRLTMEAWRKPRRAVLLRSARPPTTTSGRSWGSTTGRSTRPSRRSIRRL